LHRRPAATDVQSACRQSLHPDVLFSGRFCPSSSSWYCWSAVSRAATQLSTFLLSADRCIERKDGRRFQEQLAPQQPGGLSIFISIGLIVSTLVIYRQLHYIRNKEVGFNRDQVLVIHGTWSLGRDGTTNPRNNLLTLAGVTDATITPDLPTSAAPVLAGRLVPGCFARRPKAILMTTLRVDDHYIPTLGMQMSKAATRPRAISYRLHRHLLNEAAVATLGVKDPSI
jgi:putative ABC transport system permease protein